MFRYKLLCHEAFNDVIHIKISGDHGGKSFKMCYQVAKTKKPNSKDNMIVFNILEAKDYCINLKLCLDRFKVQIDTLQTINWQYVYI